MNTSGVLVTDSTNLVTGAASSHTYISDIADYTWTNILNHANSTAVSWTVAGDSKYYFNEKD